MEAGLNSIGKSLESSIATENLLEIIGDLLDNLIEKIFDLTDSLPIFSYFSKGIKTGLAIREAIFMEKVIAFLQGIGKTPNRDRLNMIEKIQNDNRYRYKFGKFSIIALERYDNAYKAKYLGMAAQYLAKDEITFEFYQRFSHILDSLTIIDLQEFTKKSFLNFAKNTLFSFESLGLLTTTYKLPTQSDLKLAWRHNPNILTVSHRHLTDWGKKQKTFF